MAYSPVNAVAAADSASLDAFSRWRTSEPIRHFAFAGDYGENNLTWEYLLAGTGAITTRQAECAMRLSTGGVAAGARAVRQTRRYMRYSPGKSLFVAQTFAMSAPQANAKTIVGYGDDANGIFLVRDGTAISLVRRTSVSGVVVEEVAPQANWSEDKLDGSGASGITLDLTKSQILLIDLQFLGVGRVRVGFDIAGMIFIVHHFENANVRATAYMQSGCLPLRGEVVNTGAAGGTATLDMICASVEIEGGVGEDDREQRLVFNATRGVPGLTTGTALKPVLAIRAATKLGGGAAGTLANHGLINLKGIDLGASGGAHYYEVWLNVASLTDASWQAVNAKSLAEFDIAATAFTTGADSVRVASGYIGATNSTPSSVLAQLSASVPLVYGALAGQQDTLTICMRTITGAGVGYASLDWAEQY